MMSKREVKKPIEHVSKSSFSNVSAFKGALPKVSDTSNSNKDSSDSVSEDKDEGPSKLVGYTKLLSWVIRL